MLRYEFVVLLMMASFLLVKGLRIAMMYQGVNVEGLEAYPLSGFAVAVERDDGVGGGQYRTIYYCGNFTVGATGLMMQEGREGVLVRQQSRRG
ncbi:MAG: hypothetical protein Q8L82_02165 [Nitrosomonas sp.]|nr:hypothetical protein [Nitrosomonas sp.]